MPEKIEKIEKKEIADLASLPESIIGTTEKEETSIKIEWSPENEVIIIEWCDIAQCYKWLHNRAHQKYSIFHAWFTIPAIIFSTVSGTASFAQGSLPLTAQTYAPMAIGSVNILIGILTTIQQYLKISELNESHRVSAIAWDKFARNIRIELAKAPCERMDAGHFLKVNRDEFDRLMETSPSVPQSVTREFLNTFSGIKTYWYSFFYEPRNVVLEKKEEELLKKKRFKDLKKPDVCNTLVSADETRHKWYLDYEKNKEHDVIQSTISQKIDKFHDRFRKEEEMKRKSFEENIKIMEAEKKALEDKNERIRIELEEENVEKERKAKIQKKFQLGALEIAKKIKTQNQMIDEHVKSFYSIYGRNPLKDEVNEALYDTTDHDILDKFLDRYNPDIVPADPDEQV